MKILVDTSIWSLALRRSAGLSVEEQARKEQALIAELRELIGEVRVAMIGPIRQELLSGITGPEQFSELKEKLHAFEDLRLDREDYERAAEYFNTCRKFGVQGSQVDFLICAVASGRGLPIFTADKDFVRFAKRLPIALYRKVGS